MHDTRAIQLVRDGRLVSLAVQASMCSASRAPEFTDALSAALDEIEDGPDCDVVVVRASGREAEQASRQLAGADVVRGLEKAMLRMSRLPCITLAVVDGRCERMWLQLALACDQRIATSVSSVRVPELREGAIPSLNAFALTRYVGLGLARRLLFTGQDLPARECLVTGIFDRICESEGLENAVKQFVQDLADLRRFPSLALTKAILRESLSAAPDELLGSYLAAQERCFRLAPHVTKDGYKSE